MNRILTTISLTTALLAACGCAHSGSHSQPGSEMAADSASDEKSEVTIKLTEAPEAVRTAARKLTAEANITRVIRETDDGITTYEVEYTDAGIKCAAILSATGDVIETERTIAIGTLPAAAAAALRKDHAGATISAVQIVTKTYYEVEITENGKNREVKVEASGSIEDEDGENDGESENQ